MLFSSESSVFKYSFIIFGRLFHISASISSFNKNARKSTAILDKVHLAFFSNVDHSVHVLAHGPLCCPRLLANSAEKVTRALRRFFMLLLATFCLEELSDWVIPFFNMLHFSSISYYTLYFYSLFCEYYSTSTVFSCLVLLYCVFIPVILCCLVTNGMNSYSLILTLFPPLLFFFLWIPSVFLRKLLWLWQSNIENIFLTPLEASNRLIKDLIFDVILLKSGKWQLLLCLQLVGLSF